MTETKENAGQEMENAPAESLPVGAWIITLVALFAIIGPYAADWNETHIYNPRWTPHAKFHNAQTMLLGTGLGISALWFVWRRKGDRKTNLIAAITFASLYWITQAGSITFPGTALFDPEFVPDSNVPVQPIMDVVILGLLGVAYYLENRRLKLNDLHQANI
jgi:hypothetical protein